MSVMLNVNVPAGWHRSLVPGGRLECPVQVQSMRRLDCVNSLFSSREESWSSKAVQLQPVLTFGIVNKSEKPRIGLRLVQSAANEETWKVRQISIPDYAAMKPVLKSLQSRSFVTTLETALSACLSLVTFKLSQISIHTVK